MKLGTDFPIEWKEKSKKNTIALSDLLYGYVVEDLMFRIAKSSFANHLWLTNDKAIGEDAYKKVSKECISFLYMEQPKSFSRQIKEAGDRLDETLLREFLDELFAEDTKCIDSKICWNYSFDRAEETIRLQLNAHLMEMQVPVMVIIESELFQGQKPKKREFTFLFEERKTCEYFSYSRENVLTESLFEIMHKLELISDMEHYDTVNEILMTQSISGRHVLEDLKSMTEKSPKTVSMKRMEQITSYKEYGYMKKKWQQYCRNKKGREVSWEEVMDRLLTFLTPLWKALCEDEIFFDDWMPELGRFLS